MLKVVLFLWALIATIYLIEYRLSADMVKVVELHCEGSLGMGTTKDEMRYRIPQWDKECQNADRY